MRVDLVFQFCGEGAVLVCIAAPFLVRRRYRQSHRTGPHRRSVQGGLGLLHFLGGLGGAGGRVQEAATYARRVGSSDWRGVFMPANVTQTRGSSAGKGSRNMRKRCEMRQINFEWEVDRPLPRLLLSPLFFLAGLHSLQVGGDFHFFILIIADKFSGGAA